jgi:DNA ligase 1
MLAKPSSSLDDVLKMMDKKQFTCEFKYHGIRAQIHYQRDPPLLKIYNRKLQEMTKKYPAIIEFFKSEAVLEPSSFILDTEILEDS